MSSSSSSSSSSSPSIWLLPLILLHYRSSYYYYYYFYYYYYYYYYHHYFISIVLNKHSSEVFWPQLFLNIAILAFHSHFIPGTCFCGISVNKSTARRHLSITKRVEATTTRESRKSMMSTSAINLPFPKLQLRQDLLKFWKGNETNRPNFKYTCCFP